MNIQEKLQYVQERLKAPKGQYNEFGKYNYRSCEDIQEATKPLLSEIKAALITGDELVLIGERYYVRATVIFLDCESPEQISNTAYAREEESKKGMDASQVTGTASSYARKYALNGLFCIDDVKDSDTPIDQRSNSSQRKSGNSQQKKPSSKQEDLSVRVTQPMINSIKSLVEKHADKGAKMDKILKKYQISDIVDMTIVQFEDCMNKLKLYEGTGG